MKRTAVLCVFAAPLAMLAFDYAQEIAAFRAQREQSLRAPDGWTTVVGLSWLKQGENRIGSGSGSDVPLPAPAPARLGTLTLKGETVLFQPAPGVNLSPQQMKEDTTILSAGTVKFFVIKRGDKIGVRVKDSAAPARTHFTHLSWYPPDPSWRIQAQFTPWDKPRKLTFDTVVDGLKEDDDSPGYVTFQRDGREFRLEPVLDEGELFFIFRDQTSGKTTYGASRFLYAEAPKSLKASSAVILDFNKAINPPCVFTAYATCPLPPPQNRLALAVTAGELMYNDHR